MNAKDHYCQKFAEKHNISPELISDHEVEAIHWLEHSRHIVDWSCSARTETLIYEPTWGLLQAMIDRVYEYTTASFVLYIVGHPSSAEVVARTAVEAAINVMYILDGDRSERLREYFSSYIATERRQNRLWLDSISKYKDGEGRQVHRRGIERKERVLNLYETFLHQAFQQMGFVPQATNETTWPNLFDRFKALGKETSYRTTYAAMCSQAHNDAEDLINKFVVHSLRVPGIGKELASKELASETVNFSQMLIYFGLQYYLEAIQSYAKCFSLTEAEKELNEGYRIISSHLVEIVREIHPDLGV